MLGHRTHAQLPTIPLVVENSEGLNARSHLVIWQHCRSYGARSGQLSVYALQKGIADGIADQYALIQVLAGVFRENYQAVANASQTALKAANQVAGNDMYSTPFHEMYHCKQAQDYEAKYGKITADNYSEYIRELRAECKDKLDRLEITGQNFQ